MEKRANGWRIGSAVVLTGALALGLVPLAGVAPVQAVAANSQASASSTAVSSGAAAPSAASASAASASAAASPASASASASSAASSAESSASAGSSAAASASAASAASSAASAPEAASANSSDAASSAASADEVSVDEKPAAERGAMFVADGLSYQVTGVASAESAGEVMLVDVPSDAKGALAIPAQVESPDDGRVYEVTGLWFQAFANRADLTSVTIPNTVSSYRFNNNRLSDSADMCFVGCTALADVAVEGGNPCLASEDGVLYALDASGDKVSLLAYPQAKADKKAFVVPKTVSTIVPGAFKGNTALASVTFESGLQGDEAMFTQGGAMQGSFTGGIGKSAFEGCTGLKSVTFPDDAVLATQSLADVAAIGSYAFRGCTSLVSFDIPAIATSERKGDAYGTFEDYNPKSTFEIGADSQFVGGYAPYWHNASGPVARQGIGAEAFANCTALKTVVVRSSGANGAFSYWTRSSRPFAGCSKLKLVIYEGAQAWWGDPEGSMQNGSYSNFWTDEKSTGLEEEPELAYTVEYYATQADAQAKDADEKILGRVAYRRGTPIADIATGKAEFSGAAVDSKLYARAETDGQVPDAAAAAKKAGLGAGTWVWKLADVSSRREGLVDSCIAYLVRADDLSAGRFASGQLEALYRQASRNLSRNPLEDVTGTAFDPQRYFAEPETYVMGSLDGEQTPWYSYDASADALDGSLDVVAVDGTVLDPSSYKLTYQVFNQQTGLLETTKLGAATGPILVTATPAKESGYTGTLQEWILVETVTGELAELFGDTPADTAAFAKKASVEDAANFSGAPISVTVGSADAIGALVAAGFAGLGQGAVNVEDSDDAAYGFKLHVDAYADGEPADASAATVFARLGADDAPLGASDYAVSCYKAFERRRASLGISSEEYPWGAMAIVVPQGHEQDASAIASYAYAHAAPVFFADDSGMVPEEATRILSGFESVVVAGPSSWLSSDAYEELARGLGTKVKLSRLGEDASTAAEFSSAVAAALVEEEAASYEYAAVVDGANPVDVVAALDFTGRAHGVLLVARSTSDAKVLASKLHENAMAVRLLALFGRQEGNPCALKSNSYEGNAFGALWLGTDAFDEVMADVENAVDEYGQDEGVQQDAPAASDANVAAEQEDASDGPWKSLTQSPWQSLTPSGNSATGADAPDEAEQQADVPQSEGVVELASAPAIVPTTYAVTPVSATIAASEEGAADGQEPASAQAESGDNRESQNSGQPGSAGASSAPASDAQATPANANADDQAARSGLEEADDMQDQPLDTKAPLSDSLPFLATLGALCSSSIPILRRCK